MLDRPIPYAISVSWSLIMVHTVCKPLSSEHSAMKYFLARIRVLHSISALSDIRSVYRQFRTLQSIGEVVVRLTIIIILFVPHSALMIKLIKHLYAEMIKI